MKEDELNILNKYRTAIMGIAAIWIFLFHEQEHEWAKVFFSPQWLSYASYFAKRIGFSGVDIFLLMSGIGLVYAREKHKLSVFYMRRIQRVFIPFVLVAVAAMYFEKWSFIVFLKKAFFFDFLFVGISSFLWFVPAILILYICFPLYYKCFKKANSKLIFTLCAVGVWLTLSMLLKDTMRADLYGFTNRIPIFLIGIQLGWVLREKNLKITTGAWIVLALVFALGCILTFFTIYKDMFLLVPASGCFIPSALLAISSTFFSAKFFSIISKYTPGIWITKIFSFFGTISLEIYCVQERLDDLIRPLIMGSYENWINNFIWINLGIFICVLAAASALHYFSEFVINLISSYSKKKST